MSSILSKVLPPGERKTALPNYPYFLTPARINFISGLLETCMLDRKPFLNTGFCIRDLAEAIQVPAYQLSAFINQQIGMNFNDYFNWFRVKYCQELMQKGLVGRLNLRGLAHRCGFNNRNTLTTAFKKFTGLTPSDYSKAINNHDTGIYVMWELLISDRGLEKKSYEKS